MAKGISELDVHNAADDLVALGERPTVERIRSHLGTGSPNTVTRWLERGSAGNHYVQGQKLPKRLNFKVDCSSLDQVLPIYGVCSSTLAV